MDLSPNNINWSRFSHRLWRAWDVDVRVNFTLYLVLLGVLWIPFSEWGHLPRNLLMRESAEMGLLFIAMTSGIVIHELGHAVAARVAGGKVRLVLIHALGGFTVLEEDEGRGIPEAVMIIASGPMASAGYGLIFSIAGFSDLADFNYTVALFNAVPILPLDGGQILWHLLGTNDALRRYRIAAVRWVGRIAFGVLIILHLQWISIILLAIFWGIFEWLMWALAGETDESTETIGRPSTSHSAE